MGLTRIRAEQISDIDYKQAVRVITLTNITLTGGAPATVDGVNLVAEDRVLVAGQGTGSQNGLYYVQTVGAGSNGTWVRSTDGNETGEIEAGMIVMVTEGDVYKDTQWKLTTNNPIIIGTTALVFEQNSAFAFGNIYANGTAVLATSVGDSVTLTAGNNIEITGNNTSKTVTIGVTGISLNSIANGTSNVTVVSSGGDVTVGVGGVGNVAVFSATGVDITGQVSATGNIDGSNIVTIGEVTATGNISGSYFLGNGSQLTGLPATYGNANVSNFLANGFGSNSISTTGNISSGYLFGNATQLSGINAFGNIAVSGETTVSADSTSDTLTLAEGSGISITTDAANNVITIGSVATDSIFATGGDMDLITQAVTVSEDLGSITVAATVEYDLGLIVVSGIIQPDSLILPSKTVAELAILSASPAAQFVYCSNESGGAVPAFSDGTNWRRVTDRAIVT
jgi:hypothetical protein